MKIIYVSGAVDPIEIDRLADKYGLSPYGYSQQWWDYSMAKGLYDSVGDDLFCISVPPIPTFPSCKCLFLPKIKDKKIKNYVSLGGLNLPLIKQAWFSASISRQIKKIIKRYDREDVVILTGYIYYNTAKPAFSLRKKNSRVKVATFVPDLPDFYTDGSLGKHRILKKLFDVYRKKCVAVKNGYDGYLCFSANQMEFLNRDKPFCVIDGVFDRENIKKFDSIDVPKDGSVLYAGGVHYRYGIKELVDGFISAGLPDIKLLVYGGGDAVDYVKGKEDKNVFYCGSADRDTIFEKEKSAALLINPRPTDQDFSGCSFPSKLIEYMASGTTVLTSRLKCITEEYDKYMLYIDEVSAEGIKTALSDYFGDLRNGQKIGAAAKAYVSERKNETYQANAAVDFLKGICV